MAFAISIKAVNETARPILALWDEVGRFEDVPSMPALGYPPHITFAIYDEADDRQVRAALTSAFAGIPPIRLNFAAIGWFDNSPPVLWAAPGPSALLPRIHAAIHRAIDPVSCHPHYRPGAWVPHCTLGTRIAEDRRAAAFALTHRPMTPFEVTFDFADALRFLPVEVLEERRLGA